MPKKNAMISAIEKYFVGVMEIEHVELIIYTSKNVNLQKMLSLDKT